MAQTDPWLLPSAAPQQAAPKQPAQSTDRGVVIPNPRARQEQRAEESQAMEAERLGLSQAGEARSGRKEIRESARELRSEFNGLDPVRDYQKALPNYVAALKTQETGTGDLALVYYFAKTIDPGSAVQQGEMDNIQATDSRLPALAQKALRELRLANGKFTKEARDGLRRELQGIIAQRNQAYNSERDRYSQIASSPEYGVDPEIVIGPHFGQRFYNDIDEYWKSKAPPPPAASGGAEGPRVSVTPEQSKEYFGGKVFYDENGNIVGPGYEGGVYDSTGEYQGLVGFVSDESTVNVQDQSAPSFFGSLVEGVTGEDRATQITESLPDWTQMPEGGQINWSALKTALGTAFGGSPQEIAQIVQSNFPGTVVWQDAKGNYILRSAMDGKDYAIKPGFQLSDIPRAAAITGAAALSGGRTVAGTALREGLMQGVIQTGQRAVGGTFNPEDVALAAVGGAAGKRIEQALPGALQRVRNIRGGGTPPPSGGMPAGGAPVAPVAPTAPAAMEVAPELSPQAMAGLRAAPGEAPVIDPLASARVFQPGESAPGMRGGGAAQLDEAAIRVQRAQELPVPIELARFQRSRLFEEQQRARELAKNAEVGGPIRERLAQQQEALRLNFDRFIDETGAEIVSNPRETGIVVDEALKKLAKVSKARVNVLYKRAERAGETQEPISYQGLVDFINEQNPTTREQLAPVLKSVEEQLRKNDPTGSGMIPINALESIRKLINKTAQPGTPNEVYGRDMKGIIDTLTEGKGGELYQAARRARIEQANLFENTAIVRDLMKMKPGTTDRAVALEDIAQRAIWGGSSSVDDINKLKNALDMASSRGKRAWRELQGATMEYIRDQAYKGISRDESGQIVISPAALNTAITAMDRAGKLDAVFDKKTAEMLRTINSVAQDMFTAPPGSVNNSNTSSAILNAVDMAITYMASGLPFQGGQVLNSFKKSLQERGLKKEVKRLLD